MTRFSRNLRLAGLSQLVGGAKRGPPRLHGMAIQAKVNV